MKTKCKVCTVMCDISRGNELKACAFEHNGDENICPFDARYLDLSEYKKQIRVDAIEEVRFKVRETFKNPSSSWVLAMFDEMIGQLKEQNNGNETP